jgi:uncharacterized protein
MTTKQAHAQKHIPFRMCVVCRQRSDKRALTRLVHTGDSIYVDHSGKMSGRGAYICGNQNCWERAMTTDILNNALRTVLTNEDRNRLLQAIP